MIGQTLNKRYKITSRLGKGAMGTVYRATDSQTSQEVALKVISGELSINPEMLERFKREGEALRQLKHPNIVGFLDAFEYEEQYVIVMEYISGGSLHELIKQGALPVERAQQIALDLCDALIRAHRLNIIHRDLKPENVLITADGIPKLADFGVARLNEGTRMTRSGTQVGTPYYMAPEAWEGKNLDAQADIWSLGVVLFEMLTGQVPFGGDTGPAVMNKVFTSQPPDLKRMRSETPSGLAKIVSRMLTRDKKRRYPTMREVAVDLERGQRATSVVAKAKSPRRLPALIGIGVILSLSAIWLVTYFQTPQTTVQIASPTNTLRPTSTPRSSATPRPTNTPNPLALGEQLITCGNDVCIADYKNTVTSSLGLGSLFTNFNGFGWSQDKTRIVFSGCLLEDFLNNSASQCYRNIYVSNPDGSEAVMLVKGDNGNALDAPTWSPDDQWIVFGRSGAINMMHPDGTEKTVLRSYNSAFATAFATSWSPDSQQIATVGGTCNTNGCVANRIFHINRDASDFRVLYYSPDVEFETEIAWSPDGKLVAVTLTNGQAYTIDLTCQSNGLDGCDENSRTPIPSIPVDWLPTFRPQWAGETIAPSNAPTLTALPETIVYLADLTLLSANVGWERLMVGVFDTDLTITEKIQHGMLNGQTIFIGGISGENEYPRALLAHAPSEVKYRLANEYSTFSATIGFTGTRLTCGDGALFRVEVDSKQVYKSPIMQAFDVIEIEVDVTGASILSLITESGPEGGTDNECDLTVWGDPFLIPSATQTGSDSSTIPALSVNGLIAYYPFSGDANDLSGNGFHGLVHGAILTTDRFENPNEAYSFNGSSDYIEIPDIGNYKQLTESVWVYYKPSSPSFNSGVINNHTGWDSSYLHFQISDSLIEFSINGTGDRYSDFKFTSSNLNQWHHIAAIYDSTTHRTYFYIDGVLDTTRVHNFSGDVIIGPAWIGGWDGEPRWFKGYLDDIRFYDRVLSASEILALANER